MEKTHIWLSEDDWSLYTAFLEIWRKNNRQPVSTDQCWEMGMRLSALINLRRLDVARHEPGDIWYWYPNPDANVGVIRKNETQGEP